ncbi:hypothetical protein [Salarchaeum japonicum]|uniref:hypothetical protein n=1 Tax=Salarchaeum japonicum TaxID=555573 RepID=UPI003C71231E
MATHTPPDSGDDERTITSDFEPVLDLDDDWWVSYEKTYGLYCRYEGDGWGDDNLELASVEWPHEFERRGFYDARSHPYLLYERESDDHDYCAHLVQGGTTICHFDVAVPTSTVVTGEKRCSIIPREVSHPSFDQLTPLSEVPEEWWESVNLCSGCARLSRAGGLLPGHLTDS